MRAFKLGVVSLVVLATLIGPIFAAPTWVKLETVGFYGLVYDTAITVDVKEVVYQWREPVAGDITLTDSWGDTWPEDVYLYRYFLFEDGHPADVTEWGFTDTFASGAGVIGIRGPDELLSDALPGWSHTGDGESTPIVWSTSDVSEAVNNQGGGALAGFGVIAWGEPHTFYSASAGDGTTNAVSGDKVSGPLGRDNGFETHTATQGGWGAKPRGDNPGTMLHSNFATVYPGGQVVIGNPAPVEPPAYTMTFPSAQSITDFLPTGSTPGVLAQDYVNQRKKTEAGVFAGQVLALQLNVDFSNAGVLPGGLATWPLDAGPLAGTSAEDVLDAANVVLGGGPDSADMLTILGLTVSQLNDVVTYINEKFAS